MPTIDPTLPPAPGPVRTCIGCRTRRPSVDLVRLTRRAPEAGEAAGPDRIDVDGSSCGRGAWLCRHALGACLDLAVRRRAFDRAWRTRIGPDEANHIARALGPLMDETVGAAADPTGGTDAAVVGMTTGKG